MHLIFGCKEYLNERRFMWRHNAVLNSIVSSLTCVKGFKLYLDLPGFSTPSVITGDELRPDCLLTIENKLLYVLELTVGFKTNLKINSDGKLKKYLPLISDQENNFDKVKFVNVSISLLGVFGQSTYTFIDMLKELMNYILDTLKRKLFLLVFEHLTIYSVRETKTGLAQNF